MYTYIYIYPYQSEQDNVIMVKDILMLCENITPNQVS